ncbi:LysM peptidoglycan-binding domain-containing protein, partial [Neobacillus drentensis]|uniref:LysM peptidoglycan-binding domain-containing protein n=1 Tax=Neobacillus drentensis TaxID=220684 RepID=UPI0030025CD4
SYRQPFICPEGAFSYYVRPGDTLYKIALKFNTTVPNIIAVNNLPNPNMLYVNQQLCIPKVPLTTPCSLMLMARTDVTSSIRLSGNGVMHIGPAGESAFSVVATLPTPTELNLQRYDVYLLTSPTSSGGVSKQLQPVPNNTNLWAARIDGLEPYNISRNSVVYISGSSSQFPPPGERILLEGSMQNCK